MSENRGDYLNSAAAEILRKRRGGGVNFPSFLLCSGSADDFRGALDRRGRIQIAVAIFTHRLPCLGNTLVASLGNC